MKKEFGQPVKKRVALGLASGAWPLLQRLKFRNHVNQLALSSVAASKIECSKNECLIGHLSEIISAVWRESDCLIFIGAIGAVVRLIAPFLGSKESDPAVLVIDAKALHIVPLLGGHRAGADQIAYELAQEFGGKVIFTSDSKTYNRIPIDSFGFAWGWDRSGKVEDWKKLMITQANGVLVEFIQREGLTLWRKLSSKLNNESSENINTPSASIGVYKNANCCWHPHNLWVGIGCERNTNKEIITRAINQLFGEKGLAKESIAGISSIDLKSNEKGIISLLEENQWIARFYSSDCLSHISVPNPSKVVHKEIGTYSVAEASALLAAGEGGELLVEKRIFHSTNDEFGAATIAIAKSVKSFAPNRGELHLVGSGPGDIAFLTNDARCALSKSVVWIGYKLYLDLLEPLRSEQQVRINSSLTEEQDRCKEALDLANQGVKVALISSGDSGIYGMAGLALELLLKQKINERPHFEVHPGISAFQLAAARTGAPLMNDFCAISLSDLLTSWDKIEERLVAAAKGDFVVAIYNPRSQQRQWQLRKAIEIFAKYRCASTPIACARQLGRSEEEIEIYNLDSLPLERVDMLTVLLIGNSKSLWKDGYFVTPRGYDIR